MEIVGQLLFIGLTFLCFILLAKANENRNSKILIILGIAVMLVEVGLVLGFLDGLLNKIV